MSLQRAALPLAWAWIAAHAPMALAADSSATRGRVHLEVEGCPAVPTAGVRRALSVEIGDLLLDASAGGAGDADHLSIRCAGNFAAVEASGPSADAPSERMLRLDDFPVDAVPRVLALVGIELLAARSVVVRDRILRGQPGEVAPVVATVAATAAPRSAPAEREVRIGLTAVWRTFVAKAGASAFGGRLEASTATKLGLVGGGDLEIAAAHRDVDTVGQTTAWLFSGRAALGMCVARPHWRGTMAVGGRVGLVRESGRSADPMQVSATSFVRPWGGPTLTAGLSGSVGRFALTIAGEAGWSLSSVEEVAGNATAIAIRGPWLALSVGADVRR